MPVLIYEIVFLISSLILGTLFHFGNDVFAQNIFTSIIFPINESIWEHCKLAFFPIIITSFLEYHYLKQNKNFIFSKSLTILISIILIIALFYTYNGAIGKSSLIIDILIYYFSITLSTYIGYKFLISPKKYSYDFLLLLITLILIAFIIFSFKTPNLPIFKSME